MNIYILKLYKRRIFYSYLLDYFTHIFRIILLIFTGFFYSYFWDFFLVGFKYLKKYFSALQRLFAVDEVLAWNTNLRSKTVIRTKNTRYFVDPSIAAASLWLTPQSLFKDMKLFGFLFESLSIRDLKIYASAIDASVYHYRVSLNRECDAVIVYRDGEFGLVEIKLGSDEDIEEAATNLKKIRDDLIDKPIYLMVITKEKYAY